MLVKGAAGHRPGLGPELAHHLGERANRAAPGAPKVLAPRAGDVVVLAGGIAHEDEADEDPEAGSAEGVPVPPPGAARFRGRAGRGRGRGRRAVCRAGADLRTRFFRCGSSHFCEENSRWAHGPKEL